MESPAKLPRKRGRPGSEHKRVADYTRIPIATLRKMGFLKLNSTSGGTYLGLPFTITTHGDTGTLAIRDKTWKLVAARHNCRHLRNSPGDMRQWLVVGCDGHGYTCLLFDKDTGAIGTRADLRVHYSTDNMPSAERKNRRIRKATERVQKLARPYALPVDAKGKLEPSEYVAKVSEQIIAQQRRRKQRRRTYNRALRLFEYIQEEVRNGTTQFLSAFWKRSKYGTKAGIRVVREHTTKPIVAVVKEAVNVLSPAYKEPTECAVFSDVNLGIITHITEPLSGEAIRKLQIKEASLDIEGWHDNGEIQIVLYKGQPTKVVAYDLEICRALKVGDSSGRPLELMLIRQQRMDEILLERHRGKAQVQQQSVNSRIWADNHSTKIEIEEPETDKGWVPFAKWWASAKSNRNRKAK